MPPDMPAARFRPTAPRITTTPPVMYSHGVVAGALDDDRRAGVAHAAALAHDAADEDLAAGRAVADHVAGDDVLVARERGVGRRSDDDAPARESLAGVVVRVAGKAKGHARGMKAPRLWPEEPTRSISMRSSGSSRAPRARVIALPVNVPTARLTFRMAVANRKGVVRDALLTASWRNVQSSAPSRPCSCLTLWWR